MQPTATAASSCPRAPTHLTPAAMQHPPSYTPAAPAPADGAGPYMVGEGRAAADPPPPYPGPSGYVAYSPPDVSPPPSYDEAVHK